jgi:anti-anti-sigma factor
MADEPLLSMCHLQDRKYAPALLVTATAERISRDETCDRFRTELDAVWHAHPRSSIILDLHEVQYISNVFLSVLVAVRKQLLAAGGRLVLCNLAPQVLDVFLVTRLASPSGKPPAVFAAAPDLESALKLLQRMG